MSDDTNDQIHEEAVLASAYLDGEASPGERALVETSPDTLAEVDALGQVRTVLEATAPVAALSVREGHLASALDVWERMSDRERAGEATPSAGIDAAAAAALVTPASTSDSRRGRSGRRRRGGASLGASQWFLGAAATLVVVAGVAAVVRGILDEDPATNDVALVQDEDEGAELSEVEANEAAEVEGRNVGTEVVVDPELIADQVQANPDGGGLFPDDTDETEVPTGAVDDTAKSEDAAADDDGGLAEQPAPAPDTDRVELDSPEALADYGSLVLSLLASGPATSDDIDVEPPFNSCEAQFGIEELLEPAIYQGQDVLVGVDLDLELVFAYTPDCTLVARTPLPAQGRDIEPG